MILMIGLLKSAIIPPKCLFVIYFLLIIPGNVLQKKCQELCIHWCNIRLVNSLVVTQLWENKIWTPMTKLFLQFVTTAVVICQSISRTFVYQMKCGVAIFIRSSISSSEFCHNNNKLQLLK